MIQSPPANPAVMPTARLGRRLLLLNLLLLVLVVALVLFSQTASRRNFTQRAEVATENLAATLAQGIGAEVDRVDLGLRNVLVDLESGSSRGQPDAARIEELLLQQLKLLPQLESLRIADAQGVVRYGQGVDLAGHVEIGDRPFFIGARDGVKPEPVVFGPLLARAADMPSTDLDGFRQLMKRLKMGKARGRWKNWSWEPNEADRARMAALLYRGPRAIGLRRRPEEIAGWPEVQRELAPVALDAAGLDCDQPSRCRRLQRWWHAVGWAAAARGGADRPRWRRTCSRR